MDTEKKVQFVALTKVGNTSVNLAMIQRTHL